MSFLDSLIGFSFISSKLEESAPAFNYAELDQAVELLDGKIVGDISNAAIKNSSFEAMQLVLDIIPYEAIEGSTTDPKIKNVFVKFIDPNRLDHIIEYSKFEANKLADLKNDVKSLVSTKVNVRPYLITCDTIVARLAKLREILAETINSGELASLGVIEKKAKILKDIDATFVEGGKKFKITDVKENDIAIKYDDDTVSNLTASDFQNILKSSGSSSLDSMLDEDSEKKINTTIQDNATAISNYYIWLNTLNTTTLNEIDSERDNDAKLEKIEAAIEAIRDLAAALVETVSRNERVPMETALAEREQEVSPRATGSRLKNTIFKNLRNSLAKSLLPAINAGQITAPGGYFALYSTLLNDNTERMERIVRERVYRGDVEKANEFLRTHSTTESAEEAHQLDYLNSSEQWIIDWIESDQDGTFPEKKAVSCAKTIESLAEVKRKEIKNFYLSKGFNISNFAAFRIKPEIRLPLYQKVRLAVTNAERIAETPLGKVGKGLSYLYDATYTDGTAAGNNAQNKAVFQAVNKLFSSVVTLIGGKQAGRDYEKAMHKFTNSVMPLREIGFTSEDPNKEVFGKVKEDMLAPLPMSSAPLMNPALPGQAHQTPSTLPDQNMDTFALAGPQKKDKKSKKKSSAKIMNFAQFMKHATGE